MKLIIDIDEELYEAYKGKPPMLGDEGMDMIAQAIAQGIPLPDGHGDLIDRDVAYDVLDNADLSLNCSGLLKYIPTVIPADK